MGIEFIIILVVAMMAMMFFSGRSQKKQAANRERAINALKPGDWVMTQSGFMGQLVDIDGQVAIVETADGTETYWMKQVISPIDQPPFGADEPVEQAQPVDASDDDSEGRNAVVIEGDEADDARKEYEAMKKDEEANEDGAKGKD